MFESWHQDFNPQSFFSRIDIRDFLDKNQIDETCRVESIAKHCVFCNELVKTGILLNNKSFLCSDCFKKIIYIQFPEKYEIKRRIYLKENAAREKAKEAFIKSRISAKIAVILKGLGYISFVLVFIKYYFFVVPLIWILLGLKCEEYNNKQIKKWEKLFPQPNKPILRHFHDPKATLTKRDKRILYIFDHWPGYPPFWNYLKEHVKQRDGYRCQVTGCPSRLNLHVHHKIAVSKGGRHEPNNLITLCDFHHGLEPQTGHERIWGAIRTKYFILVQEHERTNRSGKGSHKVKAHPRRKRLITPSDFEYLADLYGFHCPNCKKNRLKASLNFDKNSVTITCLHCQKRWSGPQQLAEETGPRVAELLIVTKNKGSWAPNWEMLEKRKKNLWGECRQMSRPVGHK